MVVEAALGSSEYLAVTHHGFAFMAEPVVRVLADGRELQPLASDWNAQVFRCDDCGTGQLRIEVRAAENGLVDMVVF